ncbi:C-type lectin domain family 7 member A-like [Panulirus ornatus]|uniref:C-type lectin domain family 7 member A-like n=1 Tax=Panulirus ornatus TaxID=150431 RepID=UPI003A8BD543
MWARGFKLLVFLVLYLQGQPKHCILGEKIAVQTNDQIENTPDVTVDLLRQEVQELSYLITVFLAQPRPQTTKVCRTPYVAMSGRCIVVLDKITGSWANMRKQCNNLGGDLLKVDDANFMADLIQYINAHPFNAGRYWIGASDLGHEGNWRWPDGSLVRLGTPFWGDYGEHLQQPDDGIHENCVNMPRDDRFFFHNGPCNEVNSGICEY